MPNENKQTWIKIRKAVEQVSVGIAEQKTKKAVLLQMLQDHYAKKFKLFILAAVFVLLVSIYCVMVVQ